MTGPTCVTTSTARSVGITVRYIDETPSERCERLSNEWANEAARAILAGDSRASDYAELADVLACAAQRLRVGRAQGQRSET